MADCLLLLSGGLDSSILAYQLIKQEKRRVRALFFDMSREASFYELAAAKRVASELDMPLEVAKLEELDRLMLGHLPTKAFFLGIDDKIQKMTTLPMCKVANLLPVVLNVASYYAHGVEVDEIDLALTAEQIELNPHWPEFFHSFSDVLQQFCTEQPRIQFRTPFAELTKAQVLARGKELGVSLADTWTCTRGRELHDGVCLSCQSRKAAFRDAKIEDPTMYRDSRC